MFVVWQVSIYNIGCAVASLDFPLWGYQFSLYTRWRYLFSAFHYGWSCTCIYPISFFFSSVISGNAGVIFIGVRVNECMAGVITTRQVFSLVKIAVLWDKYFFSVRISVLRDKYFLQSKYQFFETSIFFSQNISASRQIFSLVEISVLRDKYFLQSKYQRFETSTFFSQIIGTLRQVFSRCLRQLGKDVFFYIFG